ncbi:MAG: hypothetical protein DI628_01085 [Blastochloris viridis]|uniref:Uncharacterized protein n=1 Tax=Blastochloris viridis TaxID=1079 RepID=A0A6N4R233_BLAVI|nr:MAG: hypothetical protein DI628_01085 [Blastochloris viridis]
MKTSPLALAFHTAKCTLLYGIVIVPFAWFTPWAYACFVLAFAEAVKDTLTVKLHLQHIAERLARIHALQTKAYLSTTHFEDLHAYKQQLRDISRRHAILVSTTAALLDKVKTLEKQTESYVAHVKEALNSRKAAEQSYARRQPKMVLLPPSPKVEDAVNEILNLKALQRPTFKFGSPQKREEIVTEFSRAFASQIGASEQLLFNRVMCRLHKAAL